MGWQELDDPQGERGPPYGQQEDWQNILELLAAGQYRRAASLIQSRQEEGGEDSVLANSLAAARQLCLTCHQYRKEIDTHRRSLEDATEREEVLRKRILSLLFLAFGEELAEATETLADSPEGVGAQKRGGSGLWPRIRRLFAGEPEVPAASETRERDEDRPEQSTPLADVVDAPPEPVAEEERETPTPQQKRPTYRRIEPTHRLRKREQQRSDVAPEPPAPQAEMKVATEPVEEGVPRPKEEIRAPINNAKPGEPSLVVYCLGQFQVYLDEEPIEEWPSGKGRSILKYLVTHREHPVAKEILMELFWPEVDPDAARNSLNVAIYGLRQALRAVDSDFSHVLFEEDRYLLNPRLHVWVDVEAFEARFETGQRLERHGEEAPAVKHFRAAEVLYRGEFLAEDRYEEWLLPRRRQLQDDYLYLLNRLSDTCLAQEKYDGCVTLCDKILAVDPCWEDAHYRLMLCYRGQGQRYLALRQYHQCVRALAEELGDVQPHAAIQALYQELQRPDVGRASG